ncbi:MAG: protease modulator HflK [Verrucomicrobiae bacterium]|nr:protease modulator HflK [Verrucomicrobiae bacterium]
MADPIPPPGPLRPIPQPVRGTEDASSQALHEALGSSFLLVRILGVLLLAAFVFSCVFTVNPNEVAIVLRFGKPVGTGPDQLLRQGLHWAFPYPVDEIVRIRSGEAKTVSATNAWYATNAEMEAMRQGPQPNPSLNPGVDGYTLTGDGNILHVRATMTYRVSDPVAYVFEFKNVEDLLSNALNNAVHQASARHTADAAVYKDVESFRSAVRTQVADSIERYGFGVTLESVTVQVAPPGYVKEAFDAVLNAAQAQSETISKAQGYATERVLKAEGEASQILNRALSESNRLVLAMAAEAQYFRDQLPAFRRDPVLLQSRLKIEALGHILTNASAKFLAPDRADGKPRELRVLLSREPEAPVRRTPGDQPPTE